MDRLTLSSDGLRLNSGSSPFIWRGILDWPLYGRYLNEGSAVVREVLKDRRSVGANIVCCGAQLGWWPNLHPGNPGWWPGWRPFVDLCSEEGMRVCPIVFCDTATYPQADYEAHWVRFYTQLGDKSNVVLVGMNQPGHPSQDNKGLVDSGVLGRLAVKSIAGFPPLLFARENPYEGANPILPAGDFTLYCEDRNINRWMETGASMAYVVWGWGPGESWQGSRRASVLFEPWHAKPYGESGNPWYWRARARELSAPGTVGGNFYSDQCAKSQLLTDGERACAVEYLGNIPNY